MDLKLDGIRPWTAIVMTCQNKAARHAIQVGIAFFLCLSVCNVVFCFERTKLGIKF